VAVPAPNPDQRAATVAKSKILPGILVAKPKLTAQSWAEAHRPKTRDQIRGNWTSVNKLEHWVQQRKANPFNGAGRVPFAALLSGPPGVGKTTAALALLKNQGYQVIEINGSDVRTLKKLQGQVIAAATRKPTLPGSKPFAVLVEEVDGTTSHLCRQGSGATGIKQFLEECVKVRKKKATPILSTDPVGAPIAPIIMTCNDLSAVQVRNLAAVCLHLKFYPLYERDALQVVNDICLRRGINLQTPGRQQLVKAARGDMRRLNYLMEMLVAFPTVRLNNPAELDKVIAASQGDVTDNGFDVTRKWLFEWRANLSHQTPQWLQETALVAQSDPASRVAWMQENYLRRLAYLSDARSVVKHQTLVRALGALGKNDNPRTPLPPKLWTSVFHAETTQSAALLSDLNTLERFIPGQHEQVETLADLPAFAATLIPAGLGRNTQRLLAQRKSQDEQRFWRAPVCFPEVFRRLKGRNERARECAKWATRFGVSKLDLDIVVSSLVPNDFPLAKSTRQATKGEKAVGRVNAVISQLNAIVGPFKPMPPDLKTGKGIDKARKSRKRKLVDLNPEAEGLLALAKRIRAYGQA